jgi:hypothetical protein
MLFFSRFANGTSPDAKFFTKILAGRDLGAVVFYRESRTQTLRGRWTKFTKFLKVAKGFSSRSSYLRGSINPV